MKMGPPLARVWLKNACDLTANYAIAMHRHFWELSLTFVWAANCFWPAFCAAEGARDPFLKRCACQRASFSTGDSGEPQTGSKSQESRVGDIWAQTWLIAPDYVQCRWTEAAPNLENCKLFNWERCRTPLHSKLKSENRLKTARVLFRHSHASENALSDSAAISVYEHRFLLPSLWIRCWETGSPRIAMWEQFAYEQSFFASPSSLRSASWHFGPWSQVDTSIYAQKSQKIQVNAIRSDLRWQKVRVFKLALAIEVEIEIKIKIAPVIRILDLRSN